MVRKNVDFSKNHRGRTYGIAYPYQSILTKQMNLTQKYIILNSYIALSM